MLEIMVLSESYFYPVITSSPTGYNVELIIYCAF
jgi:hypothetical protein